MEKTKCPCGRTLGFPEKETRKRYLCECGCLWLKNPGEKVMFEGDGWQDLKQFIGKGSN